MNLTNINPPKLYISFYLALLYIIYDGNTDENLLTINCSPYLG